ncbi:hypothetical protein D3C73_970970 [compost metagenome]
MGQILSQHIDFEYKTGAYLRGNFKVGIFAIRILTKSKFTDNLAIVLNVINLTKIMRKCRKI